MRGLKETKPCANCGRSLTRLVSQARGKHWYCDARCQAAHSPSPITQRRAQRLMRQCECGVQFETYVSVNQRHCSQRCSSRFVTRKPMTGAWALCTCGTQFYRAKSSAQMLCSYACSYAAQMKPPVVKSCPTCGKGMRLKPSQGARLHCSRSCETTSKTKRPLDWLHNGRRARLDSAGYVQVWEPEHPRTPSRQNDGWHPLHRLVMERELGRYLRSDEQVDHINRIKDDNRPENLQVLTQAAHAVKSAGEFRSDIQAIRDELQEYKKRHGPLK